MRMRSQYAPALTSSEMLAMVTTGVFASSVIVKGLASFRGNGSAPGDMRTAPSKRKQQREPRATVTARAKNKVARISIGEHSGGRSVKDPFHRRSGRDGRVHGSHGDL
jgi:hypothetical protein